MHFPADDENHDPESFSKNMESFFRTRYAKEKANDADDENENDEVNDGNDDDDKVTV